MSWGWPGSYLQKTPTNTKVDTVCVHGDTPDAAGLAAAVRLGLEQAGITVASLTQTEH